MAYCVGEGIAPPNLIAGRRAARPSHVAYTEVIRAPDGDADQFLILRSRRFGADKHACDGLRRSTWPER